ncbi:MAG: histidinol dehydrogenase, partial [Polyangiales bacterium]
MLKIYEQGQPGYEETLASLSRRGDEDLARVEPDVRAILDAVRQRGDAAVLEYTERFDRRRPTCLVLNREAWL